MLGFTAYFISGAVLQEGGKWSDVQEYQYVSIVIIMSTLTLFSVFYIHKHSKSIEHLGIRTNSSLMKAYVIFWTSLCFVVLLQMALYLVPRDGHGSWKQHISETKKRKFYISNTSLYFAQYMLCEGLDLLVLFAYFRLGKRLSTRTTKLVTKNLRRANMMSE